MNSSTLTLNTTAANTNVANTNTAGTTAVTANAAKPVPFARIGHTLARTWDMIAVIGLMVASAAYGIYAISQMTGF